MKDTLDMRKEKLDEIGKKRVDSIINDMMKEMERKVPKPKATFDLRPDRVRKKILDKYMRRIESVFLEYGV